ncbi:LPXTG cell wall anchor domain-containing protein [Actinoplanes sp. LDG1-06]|uniref:LPXTG cell wall anchor domain-containing protein n=1 Tax=Paractinoplanes ovalisporus TaxID=2810368 RepID=A0ABS2ADC3_9ACTN|nr:LPXTG cell wall anchor domain-containing protein [Actinoplanes ovalisporus]MBM2617827.1 LPXTG cell wall anchor domain-containing protein [Actinoplanes ovalisporus]
MSTIRRIIAVGLPAAGLTAALALGVSPALATSATVDPAAMPVVAATGYGTPDATDDDEPTRGQGGYGTPGATTATPDESPDTDTPDTDTPDTDTPTRGNPGYGPTPTASVDTVPPGVSPTTSSPGVAPATTTPGGGVSPAGALPVTGTPMAAIVSMGALLVAAGAASVWYTRRRRSA